MRHRQVAIAPRSFGTSGRLTLEVDATPRVMEAIARAMREDAEEETKIQEAEFAALSREEAV